MSGRQQWVYHVEPSRFPEDFPERLERFLVAANLSWRGLARRLRLSARCVRRWRTGTKPDSGHLMALLKLAIELDLLHYLLPATDTRGVDANRTRASRSAEVDRGAPPDAAPPKNEIGAGRCSLGDFLAEAPLK